MIADERLGFPTVKTETEFFTPLFYGDEADVAVYVSRTGNSSATFEYSIQRVSDGALCARATSVHVAMDLDQRKAVPIPDKYRRAFTKSAD